MISRTHYSVQERDTRSRRSVTGQPTLSSRLAGTTLPHLRQVLLSLSTRAKTSGALISTRARIRSKFAPTFLGPFSETVRQWVENGRAWVKRLVDQVSPSRTFKISWNGNSRS